MILINDFEVSEKERELITNAVEQIAVKLLGNGKLTLEEIRDCTGLTSDRIQHLAYTAEEFSFPENENESLGETLTAMKNLAEDMMTKVRQLELKRNEYQEHEGKAIYDELRNRFRFERWQEREQGRTEVQCKAARAMMMEQEPVQYIARVTGLSESEIEKLEEYVSN